MIPLHRYLWDITDHASSMTLFPMNFVGNSAFCEFEPFCRIKPKSCTRLWYFGTYSGLLNVWRLTGLILPYNPVTTSTNIVYVAPKMKSHYSQYLIELRWTSHNHLINQLCVKIYISMKQQEDDRRIILCNVQCVNLGKSTVLSMIFRGRYSWMRAVRMKGSWYGHTFCLILWGQSPVTDGFPSHHTCN